MIKSLFNKKYSLIHYIIIGTLGVYYYFFSIPFTHLPLEFNFYFIFFCYFLFILILLRIKKIFDIIIVLHGEKCLYLKYFFLIIWTINTIFVFFLPEHLKIILFINFIFHFIFFLNSSIFTIEDAYFSFVSTIIFFIAISDGSIINNQYQLKFLNLFVIGLSIMLFSGGYEKINSELWNKKLGVKSFILLPYISRKFTFKFMKKFPNYLYQIFNQAIIFGQLFLFFSLSFPIVRELFFFEELIFSFCLWIITEISFIGQIFTIIFAFFLIISGSVFSQDINAYKYQSSLIDFNFYDIVIICIFLFCLIRIFSDTQNKILFTINKIFFNFLKFGVFTERHIFSSIYFYEGDKNINKKFNIFDKKFNHTKYNIFSPRYLQSFQYKFSDLLNKKNKKRFKDAEKIILNYAKLIFKNSLKKAKRFDIYLVSYFNIKQWKENKKLVRSKIKPIKICECKKDKNNIIRVKVITNTKFLNFYR